jgi:hypothetical protein
VLFKKLRIETGHNAGALRRRIGIVKMNEMIGSKSEHPIWMAVVPQKPKAKDMLIVTLFSIAPIAIAVLMQKPTLRQAIVMRSCHLSKNVCQEMADFWQILATKSAQAYQKAQM